MKDSVNFSVRHWVDGALHHLWPPTCIVCGLAGDVASGRDLCPACYDALPWNRHACRRCALSLSKDDAGGLCGACLVSQSALEAVTACFAYAAPLDRLLPMFKFHQSMAAGRLAVGLMAETLLQAALAARDAALVPIPLHRQRLRQRGYDQALELARPLARQLQLRLAPDLLARPKVTGAQSRLDKVARQRNLSGAFVVNQAGIVPPHVILIDDVMTTGATLESAAQALRAAGVAKVEAWVCARVA
ncbi:ComF family protein [Solilutibacter tolerans]|uniref:ComF family protein n=1 Tax=Solilutibacter tolerans TaxID=1604334 RepID=A0A1N6RZE7_9GAMM|nr:ComF family protein [Lysobacter tolerans]SIQ34159.1 comF family protein [Lysobacter tolerans]